jgi:hypothetical protein
MSYRFEIDEVNAIRVWDLDHPNKDNAPFFYQPDWPSGIAWADAEEAQAWAELFIESLENPESEFVPGESPDEPRKPRPVITESSAE